jgi:hypothetical protein
MKTGKNLQDLWLGRSLLLAAALFAYLTASGQTSTNDAISREVSVFNFGAPSGNGEAISREVSVFNFGSPPANAEAVSREVSVFNFGQSATSVEAVSREVSVFNFGQLLANIEAISREMSIYNYGVPPVVFSIGSTNVLGGETNQVPFVLQTVLDLTNLNLMLKTDDSHLQVLAVTPASSEVVSTVSGTVSSNGHPIAFALNPAAQPPASRILAWLNFQALTNGDSAIVPLTINNLTAIRASGQAVPNIPVGGQVIVIVTKPILFVTNQPQFGITMYGVPGTTNAIEATTNLAPAEWHELERLLVSDRLMILYGLVTNAPQQFFRTRQVWP